MREYGKSYYPRDVDTTQTTQRYEKKCSPNTTQRAGRTWHTRNTPRRGRPVENWEAWRGDGRRNNIDQNHKAREVNREQKKGRNWRSGRQNREQQRRTNNVTSNRRPNGKCRDLVRKLNWVTGELAELLESSF